MVRFLFAGSRVNLAPVTARNPPPNAPKVQLLRKAAWFGELGLLGGTKLAHTILDIPAAFPGAPTKLRSVVATAPVGKGETLCVIPATSVVTGDVALRQLQIALEGGSPGRYRRSLLGTSPDADDDAAVKKESLRRFIAPPRAFEGLPVAVPHASRSARAVTLLLARSHLLASVRRDRGIAAKVDRDLLLPNAFDLWASAMPPSVPPLQGALLHVHDDVLGRGSRRQPQQPAVGEQGGEAPAGVAPMVDRFAVGAVSDLTAPSRAVLRPLRAPGSGADPAFDPNRPWPTHHVTPGGIKAADGAIAAWARTVAPALCASLPEPIVAAVGEEQAATMAATSVAWAAFMFRSRAIAFGSTDDDVAEEAAVLVPAADMLNHARPANAMVARASDENSAAYASSNLDVRPGDFLIRATVPIDAGSEVTLNYGDYRSRQAHTIGAELRGMQLGRGAKATTGSRTVDAGIAAGEERASMGRADKGLRRGQLGTREEDTRTAQRFADAASAAGRQVALMDAGVQDDELAWAWSFGFAKPEAERELERQELWEKHLPERVRRMVDPTRRGSAGEYCVGVPPGVGHLRDARRRVEAQMYRGQPVFPRQPGIE